MPSPSRWPRPVLPRPSSNAVRGGFGITSHTSRPEWMVGQIHRRAGRSRSDTARWMWHSPGPRCRPGPRSHLPGTEGGLDRGFFFAEHGPIPSPRLQATVHDDDVRGAGQRHLDRHGKARAARAQEHDPPPLRFDAGVLAHRTQKRLAVGVLADQPVTIAPDGIYRADELSLRETARPDNPARRPCAGWSPRSQPSLMMSTVEPCPNTRRAQS